jgi:uncharacterized membrane protein YciS (DUF1049 family)
MYFLFEQSFTIEFGTLGLILNAVITAVSAFFGVKIAVARIETRVKSLEDCFDDLNERTKYLERQR